MILLDMPSIQLQLPLAISFLLPAIIEEYSGSERGGFVVVGRGLGRAEHCKTPTYKKNEVISIDETPKTPINYQVSHQALVLRKQLILLYGRI